MSPVSFFYLQGAGMKNGRGMKLILIALVIALAVMLAVIIFKQMEYGASSEYYDNLRGALRLAGGCV